MYAMYSEKFKLSAPGPFFSGIDWGYHGLLMPLYMLLSNAIYFGDRYFSEAWLFFSCSLLSLLIYADTLLLLNFLFRKITGRYPGLEHTAKRMALMLAASLLLAMLMAGGILFLYGLLPVAQLSLNMFKISSLASLVLVYNLFFSLISGFGYVYRQGQVLQAENRSLETTRQQLENKLHSSQLDPRFILNSLSSLGTLIGKNAAKAERYVQELSLVYQYFLEAKKPPLCSLEEELGFVSAYFQLLKTRYGQALSLEISVVQESFCMQLPPLCLQLLLENAVKYNQLHRSSPLHIEIGSVEPDCIFVRNNLQRRLSPASTGELGLANLAARYRLFEGRDIEVEETSTHYTVIIPLISTKEAAKANAPLHFSS